MFKSAAFALLMVARLAVAECSTHSFTSCEDNIVHWYDPGTGEVCDPLDCGGGRAPPKTDVPGCPMYRGTEIYSPTTSYLSCFTRSDALLEPTVAFSDITVDAKESSTASEPAPVEETEPTDGPATETTVPTASSSDDVESTFMTTSSASITTTTAATITPTETPGTSSTTKDADVSEPTNAAKVLDGSWVAAAGAFIGVVAML